VAQLNVAHAVRTGQCGYQLLSGCAPAKARARVIGRGRGIASTLARGDVLPGLGVGARVGSADGTCVGAAGVGLRVGAGANVEVEYDQAANGAAAEP
jgi:hypothetical protein